MKIEEYKEHLDFIMSMNDNITKKIKSQKKFNKGFSIFLVVLLLAGIVGLIFRKYIPTWVYVISWVLVGLNAIILITALLPNASYEKDITNDFLGMDKDKFDNDLEMLSQLKKEDIINYEDFEEKNNVVLDKLNFSEEKYYYSKNDYIKYNSFEQIKDTILELEEYE